jgi:hypothetical protein
MAKSKSKKTKNITPAKWEQAWQQHWKNAQLNYELPPADRNSSLDERKFLSVSPNCRKRKRKTKKDHERV